MEFHINHLINDVLDNNFDTWSHTLNTADFVSKGFARKIDRYIFANMKKQFKQAEIYDLLHLQDQGFKLGFFQKLKIYFSGLKPLYLAEKLRLQAMQEKPEPDQEPMPDEHVETVDTGQCDTVSLEDNVGVPQGG